MAKYVMYILTTHSPILLTDKNFFFIKVHFCAFFNPYMDVKLGMYSTCILKIIHCDDVM